MTTYYKLLRREEIVPTLKAQLPGSYPDQWQNQLQGLLKTYDNWTVTKDFGDDKKTVPRHKLPPRFVLKTGTFSPPDLSQAAGQFEAIGLFHKAFLAYTEEYRIPEYLLVCNLSKMSVEERNQILQASGVLVSVEAKTEDEITNLLSDFYTQDKSNKAILGVSPEFIQKNFPLTYSEELAYNSISVKHPLVGYEKMLIPLEKYYKFLADQSFNEFLTILVKLGVRKIELIHSENTLMKKALEAQAGYQGFMGNFGSVSGGFQETSTSSSRCFWGMEFEGKQVSPEEIPDNFLDAFPFHRNNGTLKAMIEGIKSGNRNKTYTVERSFTGSYGLDTKAAVNILGFEAGFNFNYEEYKDEKSTFNVLY